MRWMTLAHLHLDRVASAWLIARFVDPDADFAFLPWGAAPPSEGADLRVFGVPGARLGSYDDAGTCFGKVLREFDLDDPALARIERCVAAGVRHAHGEDEDPSGGGDVVTLGVALDLLGVGFGVTSDDVEHLERAFPLYDALLCVCRVQALPDEVRQQIPRLPGERVAFLRAAIGD